jgi:hypothetical protein
MKVPGQSRDNSGAQTASQGIAMDLSEQLRTILRTVGDFERIERYGRIMPSKHVHNYKEKDIDLLVKHGLLEWTALLSGCGAEIKGVRLAEAGREAVYGDGGIPTLEGQGDVPMALVAILVDIHCFGRIRLYHGMMPKKKAARYPASDMDDLYQHGYILRMKVKTGGAKKREGYVLSAKGRNLLRSLGLIEPRMHLAGRPDLAIAS